MWWIVLLVSFLLCAKEIFTDVALPTCGTIRPTPLDDLLRRSTTYTASPSEAIVNDRYLKNGWYTADGYDMVQNRPSSGTCGTYYPTWMKGDIPKVSDGVQPMTACQASAYDACHRKIHNQILNCGASRVYYYLNPTDNHYAYCFDPHGFNSSGITISPKPAFRPNRAVVVPELTWTPPPSIPKLKFHCQFEPKPGDKDLQYLVLWSLDKRQLPAKSAVSAVNILQTALEESQLETLGVVITCGVRVKNGTYGALNDLVLSEGFFAGIRVHTPVMTLTRGSTADIIVQPTVPFGCLRPTNLQRATPCKNSEGLMLSMFDPGDTYECDGRAKLAVDKSDTCGTYLDGFDMDDEKKNIKVDWERNYTFSVTTAADKLYDLDKTLFTVKLKTGTGANSIWNDYELQTVKINVHEPHVNWKRKTCHAHVDPHMQTADNRKYDCHVQGEYILYSHKKLPMQVQYKTDSCNFHRAQCPCAASVRAGGDLFIVDKCNGNKFADFVSCKDSIIDVVADTENVYKITLPTGTEIKLSIMSGSYSNNLNIDITMSIKDFEAIEGLCGNYNGHPNDDFIERQTNRKVSVTTFAASWRIHHLESFLNPANHDPPHWPSGARLCVCQGKDTICSAKESVTCKQTPTTKDVHCRLRKNNIKERRRRMATSHIIQKRRTTIVKRAANPMSISEANVVCEGVFRNHPNFALRGQLPVDSIGTSIHECALDLNITGDTFWASAHRENWVDNSKTLIERDNTYRAAHADVAQTFTSNACPNSCSGNGNCQNGTCECDDHFTAADCSIDSRTPPLVDEIYNNGICDWQDEDCCDGFSVYGEPFVQTSTCRVEEITVYVGGSNSIPLNKLVRAHFRSTFEAVCQVNCTRGSTPKGPTGEQPFITSYDISVSNDGKHFGPAYTMLVYDSACQELINDTKIISFKLKEGFCYIAGKCYMDGEEHPTNACYICDVIAHSYDWTRDNVCQGQATPDCSSAERKLGSCLHDLEKAIKMAFIQANINFDHPTEEDRGQMDRITKGKLCHRETRQYLECTIKILDACPALIFGNEMNNTVFSKDVRRLQWYNYTNADSLCVCYDAADCLEETSKLTDYRYSTDTGNQDEIMDGAARDLLFFGESLCLYKEQIQCAQNAVTKASCWSFLQPRTYDLLHGRHQWLSEFLERQCTTEVQSDYRNSIRCISEQAIETHKCLHENHFVSAIDPTAMLACGDFAPIQKCINDTMGSRCGQKWAYYTTQLISIHFPRETYCPTSSAQITYGSADVIALLMTLAIAVFTM